VVEVYNAAGVDIAVGNGFALVRHGGSVAILTGAVVDVADIGKLIGVAVYQATWFALVWDTVVVAVADGLYLRGVDDDSGSTRIHCDEQIPFQVVVEIRCLDCLRPSLRCAGLRSARRRSWSQRVSD
jgi:hypothetical protein